MSGDTLKIDSAQKSLCQALASAALLRGRSQDIVKYEADAGTEKAWELARDHEVDAILGHALTAEDERFERWRTQHVQLKERIDLYLKELKHVAEIFAREGIPLIALKNSGIACGLLRCGGCSPMGDIDTLVRRADFSRAHQLMVENGYRFTFRSLLEEDDFSSAEKGGGAEYRKELSNGNTLWFEVQWRAVSGRWLRPDQEPVTEELIKRSTPLPGTAVRILAPEDNLMQICLHTAKHSYVRAPGFRLHLDVHRVVYFQNIDWDLFLERVLNAECCTATYFSLLIPHLLFNTEIPAEVLERLRPPAWKRFLLLGWLNRAGLFEPYQRKFGRAGYIIFNVLLYDDVRGVMKNMFPPSDWMKEQYGVSQTLLLPWYYLRRIFNLIFRRLRT